MVDDTFSGLRESILTPSNCCNADPPSSETKSAIQQSPPAVCRRRAGGNMTSPEPLSHAGARPRLALTFQAPIECHWLYSANLDESLLFRSLVNSPLTVLILSTSTNFHKPDSRTFGLFNRAFSASTRRLQQHDQSPTLPQSADSRMIPRRCARSSQMTAS
jgi:hypothetical protein